jgi:hypothetical protein
MRASVQRNADVLEQRAVSPVAAGCQTRVRSVVRLSGGNERGSVGALC